VKRPIILHPFLLAVYPALLLYGANVDEVYLSELVRPVVVLLAMGTALFLAFWGILRHPNKAALMASLSVFLIFGFELVRLGIGDMLQVSISKTVLLAICALYFALVFYAIVKLPRDLYRLTRVLNVFALVLVLSASWTIVTNELGRADIPPKSLVDWDTIQSGLAGAIHPSEPPNIYYFVYDRYANEHVLDKFYNFDNKPFQEELSRLGFYVATEATANYLCTSLSLASSLNMSYITPDEDLRDIGTETPLYALIRHSQVGTFLKSHRYRYVHFGTWWEPTRINPEADRNINLHASLSYFERTLLQTTVLGQLRDPSVEQWERVSYKLTKLRDVVHQEGPVFVMAHMLVTHPPYVFQHDGSFLSPKKGVNMSPEERYVEQIRYANKTLMETVRYILNNSTRPPVIIIQSDEGPWPAAYLDSEETYDWRTAPEEDVDRKMGILNAMYFPDGRYDGLTESVTPVNTFRLIFDRYFGTELGLLPDRSYLMSDRNHPYALFEVTNQLVGVDGSQ